MIVTIRWFCGCGFLILLPRWDLASTSPAGLRSSIIISTITINLGIVSTIIIIIIINCNHLDDQRLIGGCWAGCVDIYGHSHQIWHVLIFSGGSKSHKHIIEGSPCWVTVTQFFIKADVYSTYI